MKVFAITLLAAAFTSGAVAGPPESDLSAAKEQYAAAAYEDALATLGRAQASSPSRDVLLQIDKYRSLCLYALGRTQEAEASVRDLLQKDPLFRLEDEEESPRVEAMFADVRKQLLPSLAKERFRVARTAMDSKQFDVAETELTEVQGIIAEAQRLKAADDSLADLAVLTDGFRALAHASAAAPPPQAAAAAPTQPAVAQPAPEPARSRTYTLADGDVIPPTPIVQTIPPIPTALIDALRNREGILELTIDTDGHVASAAMRQSLNAAYDTMVVGATKLWRYKPASKDGVPVRYVKAIALAVRQ